MLDPHTPSELAALLKFPLESEHQLFSVLQFDFIPNGFFSRLTVRTLSLFLTTKSDDDSEDSENSETEANNRRSVREPLPTLQHPPLLWTDGIFLVVDDIHIFCRRYPSLNKVDIQIRGTESAKSRIEEFYCMVFDMVNGLLAQWPHLVIQRTVLCNHCIRERRVCALCIYCFGFSCALSVLSVYLVTTWLLFFCACVNCCSNFMKGQERNLHNC